MSKTTETNHAEQNAVSWFESIREMVSAYECDYDRLEELRDEKADWIANDGGDDDEQARTEKDWEGEFPDEAEELAELETACRIDGVKMADQDAARTQIEESPLSIRIRDGWRDVGADSEGAEEYEILLSTGGPALRIIGELDTNCEPTSARLQYQDWGTPWTEHLVLNSDYETLMTFVRIFYFGA